MKYLTFHILFLFIVFNIYGQTANKLFLTINDAVLLAIEKNADIKISMLEVEKSEEKIIEAKSGLFPKVDITGQYQRYLEKPVIFLPPGSPLGTTLKIGADNSYNATATLTIPLLSFSLYDGISIANQSKSISIENLRITKNKVANEVKKAFYLALLLRETKDVMIQSLKNAEENFNNIKRLNEGGTLSDYDVLRAEVQYENLKPSVLQAENNFQLSLEALKVNIGLDASTDLDISGDLLKIENKELNIEEILKDVIDNNPQLALIELQKNLYKKNIDLETSAYYPSLAGFGNYQYQAQADNFKFNDYNWVNTFVVGFQLQIPVFNGFKTNSRINQAEIGLSQINEQKRNYTELIKTQVLSIIYKMEQANKRILGQDKTVNQATEGYKIAARRLENNLTTQLELNDAELSLRQAKLNRLQAIYDYKVAESELENILGILK
ncbi:MAG TPA: TolC family protein [Melioribacteraceae bacterium]|nr:TolC family protein [Melioribacteraceae bacterium]